MGKGRTPKRAPPERPTTPDRAGGIPDQRIQRRLAVALGILAFVVYVANFRFMATGDSAPARWLPFSLLREGNFDLDEFDWLRGDMQPYYLVRSPSRHWISLYPVALPVVATPLALPTVWWLRANQVSDDDVRFRVAAAVTERVAAAAFTALSVSLVFLALCQSTRKRAPSPFPGYENEVAGGVGQPVAIALVYAFGTSTWCISSQALWQHCGAELGLAGLCLCVLATDSRRTAVWAGVFAALAVLSRISMVIYALLALLYFVRERRPRVAAFLIAPAIGAGLLLAYNWIVVGRLGGALGAIFLVPFQLEALVGMLISPNRGLLVYTPVALLALPGLVSGATRPRWFPYIGIGFVAYLVLFSFWRMWWGGYTFGPRFLIDTLPALTIAAAPAVESLWRRTGGKTLLAGLALWSIGMQVIGVSCDDGAWNHAPVSVDESPQRVWDWSDWQPVRAARTGWRGAELASVLRQTVADSRPVIVRPLAASDLAGRIEVRTASPLRVSGTRQPLALRVTNLGDAPWPAFTDTPFLRCRLLYRFFHNGVPVANAGGLIDLPVSLHPGESTDIDAAFDPPHVPGSYEIELIVTQVIRPDAGVAGASSGRVALRVE